MNAARNTERNESSWAVALRTNCFVGHGGTDLSDAAFNTHQRQHLLQKWGGDGDGGTQACAHACREQPGCFAVVVSRGRGTNECHFRASVSLDHCVSDQRYDTHYDMHHHTHHALTEPIRLHLDSMAIARTSDWGRGVVMCAGGGPPFHFALHAATATARLLRQEFSLEWPLEVYFVKEEAMQAEDLAPGLLRNWTAAMHLQGLNASARVLGSRTLLPGERGQRFSCKASAVLETQLSEVLFLDSDVALVGSPLRLFQTAEYVRTGALFFHDRQINWLAPETQCRDVKCVEAWLKREIANPSEELMQSNIWRGTGSAMRVESGVIVIDKVRHARTLATLQQRYKALQAVSHGEKEAWWISAEATRPVPDPPGPMYMYLKHAARCADQGRSD